ncbi:MAG: hypothetical protein ACE5H4_07400 [Candidatus Thorarchaeota archaeon]
MTAITPMIHPTRRGVNTDGLGAPFEYDTVGMSVDPILLLDSLIITLVRI